MSSLHKVEKRETACADQNVADISKLIDSFMERRCSRDLVELLKPFDNQSWTTSPRLDLLFKVKDIVQDALPIAPNTMLSQRKLVLAILNCHLDKPCIFSKKPIAVEARCMSGFLRIAMGKWRDVKQSPSKLAVVISQAYICVYLLLFRCMSVEIPKSCLIFRQCIFVQCVLIFVLKEKRFETLETNTSMLDFVSEIHLRFF